ncbi:hypothetical protein BRC97_05965 [Halobacteriales archaeon QS_6_71_20]|nr:MAG: hypothetical protein BRC97_05965 [Halobacteriales archaeon QS_6_71_20]
MNLLAQPWGGRIDSYDCSHCGLDVGDDHYECRHCGQNAGEGTDVCPACGHSIARYAVEATP